MLQQVACPSLMSIIQFLHCLADAQWLIKTFFVHYTTELAELDVPLTNSVDSPFLTHAVLEDVDWEHQPSCGSAWHQAVESALLGMSLENRYALLKQRFPRALSGAGVNTAGRCFTHTCSIEGSDLLADHQACVNQAVQGRLSTYV